MSTTKEHLRTDAAVIVAVLGCTALAQAYEFAGGTGAPNDPYQIATAEHLIAVGADPNLLGKHFVLTADIDLDPNLPGGRIFDDALIAWDEAYGAGTRRDASFHGVFYGQRHTIHNLHIEGSHHRFVGLFGSLSGLVKDLHLADVIVTGSPGGAIAGRNLEGTILRCSVTGIVSGIDDVGGMVGLLSGGSLVQCECDVQVSGDGRVGGMVGAGTGAVMLHCGSQAVVTGGAAVGGLMGDSHGSQVFESRADGTATGFDGVGGLIGDTEGTTLLRCAANGEVTAELSAGGLVGRGRFSHGCLIADSYAQGSVTGAVAGGLVGAGYDPRIMNCYGACAVLAVDSEHRTARAGGILGTVQQGPMLSACFWDAERSGLDAALGDPSPFYRAFELGTGLTTQQMQDPATFEQAGWDLDYVWTVPEADYPMLRWEPDRPRSTAP